MAHSYQDVNVRLKVLEDKIDFVMNFFVVKKQIPNFANPYGGPLVTQATLLEVYRELKALGPDITVEKIEGESGLVVDLPIVDAETEQRTGDEVV